MDVAKIVSDAQGGSQLLLQPSPLLHLKLLLKEVAPKMADTGVRPGLQACPSRFTVNRRRWLALGHRVLVQLFLSVRNTSR